MSNLLKKKVVEVKDSATGKVRKFVLTPAGYNEGAFDCERVCPLAKFCEHLPDPRNTADPDSNLCKWCGSFCENDEIGNDYLPADGAIEDAFADDPNIIQMLAGKNPTMVKLKDFAEEFCPSFCEKYDPSFCNCDGSNATCLIQKLLQNKKLKITGNGEGDYGTVIDRDVFNSTDEAKLTDETLV